MTDIRDQLAADLADMFNADGTYLGFSDATVEGRFDLTAIADRLLTKYAPVD